jgi:hypothetical protein
MKYAHTPSESPPAVHSALSRPADAPKSEIAKSAPQLLGNRPISRSENDNGDDSEEEREKRLRELQDQVRILLLHTFIAVTRTVVCRQ